MEKCSSSPVPIQKGDKFSLNQCPKNDLERKQMKDISYASIVESLMSPDCGDCLFKPQPQPGCNNNTCFTFGDNPLIDWFDNSGEVEEDVLAIGSTPGVRVTWPGFIFTCMLSRDMVRLFANGVTGFGRESPISIPNQLVFDPKFTRKFGVCLSSSTKSRGVIYICFGPYCVYNPTKIGITNDLLYAKLIAKNKRGFVASEEYYIQVSSIRIAGQDVPLNKTLLFINKKEGGGDTMISTAKPFTILRTSIYDAFKTTFIKALPKNVSLVEPPTKQFGVCFSSKNIRNTNSGPDVPVIDSLAQAECILENFWDEFSGTSTTKRKEKPTTKIDH
ncbi:hypothetical protein BC332_08146 [Capsicum chinense]|nr:hypothetical protein BC332_08146 [Capsicum chinense]